MNKTIDSKIGKITIRRSIRSNSIKIKVAPNGSFIATMPYHTPLFLLKRLVNINLHKLSDMMEKSRLGIVYTHGSIIGRSHKLIVTESNDEKSYVKKSGLILYLYLNKADNINDNHIQDLVKPYIIKALRSEAKNILPFRLNYFSKKHNLSYTKIRYSHAGSRWGSCSSRGVISLNIALMKLPPELTDYVICHELAHTKELNHSKSFWNLVESLCPEYKTHKNKLKSYSPII